LDDGIAFDAAEFTDFAGRVEVKEYDFAKKPKKGQRAVPEMKMALLIKGNWDREDFDELNDVVELFPEQIEGDEGEGANKKRAFVKKATEAHRKNLRALKAKKEGKKDDGDNQS